MRDRRGIPRLLILALDLCLSLCALYIAYQLRFNFNVPGFEVDLALPMLPYYLITWAAIFYFSGIHKGIVRYTSTEDARRIFMAVVAGTVVIGVLNVFRYFLIDGTYLFPRSVLIIAAMALLILMISLRIAVKLLFLRVRGAGLEKVQVVIYGAGEAGLITKRTLEREGSAKYAIRAFVDDDKRRTNKRLEGVPVIHSSELARILSDGSIAQVIISIQRPDPENRRKVIDTCMDAGVRVLNVPPVSDWINGQLSSGQIREVRIEDLLGREVIRLEDDPLKERFANKRILVTGAAGSIGSELVRQLIGLNAAQLILLDHAESPLYDLEMELQGKGLSANIALEIADVRDRLRVEQVFVKHRPEVVFHAAAYKHVPLMEANPSEAVRTNILGTRHVAELSCAHAVEELVLISTDKAVNPTSVMGASKRVAEILVSLMAGECTTRIMTTRFGNVLGSSGSVIPLFRRQIEAGGPVTVTHPEVTRFFMTIPEACRLVLEAASMGRGGEIYLFDMGKAVRIADLAEKMIRLSGLEPGRDIEIKYVGLRPGEKLYEELLADQENTLPTHHPQILIGRVRDFDASADIERINELLQAAGELQDERVRQLLKALVPEYLDPSLQQ